jgi:hypothetical protein
MITALGAHVRQPRVAASCAQYYCELLAVVMMTASVVAAAAMAARRSAEQPTHLLTCC